MRFFSKFPKTTYDLSDNKDLSIITNIFRNVAVDDKRIIPLLNYEYTQIIDGERPDNTSMRLYGDESYAWTFFLLNEHLMKGISNWTTTQSVWREWIDKNYGIYSNITFLPKYAAVTSSNIGGVIYTNLIRNNDYLAGIDYDNVHVRLVGVQNGSKARVQSYSVNNYQAWCYEHTNNDAESFIANTSYNISYEDVQDIELRKEWLLSMEQFLKINQQPEYTSFAHYITTNSIIVYSDEWFDDLYDLYVSNITLTPESNRSYYPSYKAPKRFTEHDSHLDALLGDAQDFTTYWEYEEDVREVHAQIRTIQPQYIADFARTFKEIISHV